jgi:hypothetical protein
LLPVLWPLDSALDWRGSMALMRGLVRKPNTWNHGQVSAFSSLQLWSDDMNSATAFTHCQIPTRVVKNTTTIVLVMVVAWTGSDVTPENVNYNNTYKVDKSTISFKSDIVSSRKYLYSQPKDNS